MELSRQTYRVRRNLYLICITSSLYGIFGIRPKLESFNIDSSEHSILISVIFAGSIVYHFFMYKYRHKQDQVEYDSKIAHEALTSPVRPVRSEQEHLIDVVTADRVASANALVRHKRNPEAHDPDDARKHISIKPAEAEYLISTKTKIEAMQSWKWWLDTAIPTTSALVGIVASLYSLAVSVGLIHAVNRLLTE